MNYHELILNSYDTLVAFSLDKDYRILTANKSGDELLKRMYGKAAQPGECLLDFFQEGHSRSLAKEHFDRALAGESFTIIRPFEFDKDFRYFNILYAPMKDGEEIIGFSALVSDITERQKHEEERLEANEMYRRLFYTSTDAIMTLEPPIWKFTTGNHKILDMFKVKDMAEWLSIGPWDVSPEYQPDGQLSSKKAKEMIQIAMDKGAHFFEWTHMRRTGESFPATVLLTRVNFSQRKFLQATVRDVTKEKEAENELNTQAELQNILMKISSKYINTPLSEVNQVIHDSLQEIGIFVKADRSYLFEFDYVHHTISNTFEWCADGIISVIDSSQNLSMIDFNDLLEPYFRGDALYISDTENMAEGPSKTMLLNQNIKSLLAVPLMHEKNCRGFVGFDSVKKIKNYSTKEISILRLFSDMLVNIQLRTEKQKELEKLLYTTKDQNKRLKEFSYITSHNMRASVANMIGLSQMIEVKESSTEYLNMLKTTTQKLDNSITNINELINFENEDVLEKVDCSLSEALQRVLKLTNQIIKQKQVNLTIDINESFTIKAFPAYLDSIFHNVITNALKYGITEQSKILNITARREASFTTVFIKDGGLGIDLSKYGEKMFQLGTRLHDTSDGQGLGLFMTKRQMEALGGRIEVDSEANMGTTFKLHFQHQLT
ncbi:MAG: ATP-binding protein [Reichenbachiella sp.]|uniref:ATP-binding protein n=1 Tax=Reichenbachiella sp. TaxID=2184521 RepID=UPI00326683E7